MTEMADLKDKFIMLMKYLMQGVLVDGLIRDVECYFSDEKLNAWGDILTKEAYDGLAKHFGLCTFYYSDGIFLMHIDDAVFQMIAFTSSTEFVSSKYKDRGAYYEYNFVNDTYEYRVLSYKEALSSECASCDSWLCSECEFCMSWHAIDCESVLEGFELFVIFMWNNMRSDVTKVKLLSQYFRDIEQRWVGLFDE